MSRSGYLLQPDSCPLCGSTNHACHAQIGRFQLRLCHKCGTLFRKPAEQSRRRLQFVKESLYFNHRFNPGARLSTDRIPLSTYDWIKALSSVEFISGHCSLKAKRVIDIGCGPGYFLVIARSRGAKVLGIDLSRQVPKVARDLFNIRVMKGEFPGDFKGSRLGADIVAFNDSLEHIAWPRQAISLSKRWLAKHRGLVFVRTPDVEHPHSVVSLTSWRLLQPQDHLFFFSRDTLARLLSEEGLIPKVVRSHGWLLAVAKTHA
jgi:2-polyprenyl-3-methyl-5-hydroxy-6-metoxy-1,4-benzoquinol methylase